MGNVAIAYDWPRIKNLYVIANPAISLAQLADQEGMAKRTLEDHSSSEKWPLARREYLSAIASRTQGLAIEEASKQQMSSRTAISTAVDLLGSQLKAMAEAFSVKKWESEDPVAIAKASSSIANALDKVTRCNELLNGGPDSRAEVDLSTLLAQSRSE